MISNKQLEINRETYIALLRKVNREGIEELINFLDKSDFFTAPASGRFHGNYDGGLCEHSLNVCKVALSNYKGLKAIKPSLKISEESIIVSALLHDLCKIGFYNKAERWTKKDGQWTSYDGYEIKDPFPFGHGEKSVLYANQYIKLELEEMLAIRWHMGYMDMSVGLDSSSRYAFQESVNTYPIVTLIHTADWMSSTIIEEYDDPLA